MENPVDYKAPLKEYPSRVLVGSFNETQLRSKEDKKAVAKMMEQTGYKYVITRLVKRKGEQLMDIYLISNDEYYQTNEF